MKNNDHNEIIYTYAFLPGRVWPLWGWMKIGAGCTFFCIGDWTDIDVPAARLISSFTKKWRKTNCDWSDIAMGSSAASPDARTDACTCTRGMFATWMNLAQSKIHVWQQLLWPGDGALEAVVAADDGPVAAHGRADERQAGQERPTECIFCLG